jgi:hypothetical protein
VRGVVPEPDVKATGPAIPDFGTDQHRRIGVVAYIGADLERD